MKVVVLDPTGPDELAFLQKFAPRLDLVAPASAEESLQPLLPGAAANTLA